MLELVLPELELYHQVSNRFIMSPECILVLEHSLISIAKWESKWHVSYLSDSKKKTKEQEIDYIRCMTVNTIKDEHAYERLTQEHILQIQKYIDDPMSATTFSKSIQKARRREIITAEKIYARMFNNGIPIECHKWHLNRLLALLRVCDLMNSPSKKMNKSETARWNAQQNAARRAKYNTRG